MQNILKKIDFYLLLLMVIALSLSVMIFYRIGGTDYFYISRLGDIKEQYIHFFNLFHNLVRSGEMPFWSWEFGPGGSFWNQFGYYILGDIFIWPLLLFPVEWFPYSFIPMSMLKILLMAIGMYLFLKELGLKKQVAVLFAISYSFPILYFEYFYTHYFFINSAVFFPFILWGYERYIRSQQIKILVISLFLTGISNFYFLFMITVGLFFYSMFRYFTMDQIKISKLNFIKFHFKLSLVYLAALGLSMFIFLPSVFGFLDSNVTVRPEKPFFEPVLSFDEMLRKLIWEGGISFLPLITVPILLINGKKNFFFGLMGCLIFLTVIFQNINSFAGGFSLPGEFRAFFLYNTLLVALGAIALNNINYRKMKNLMFLWILSIGVYYWLSQNPFTHYGNLLKYLPLFFTVTFSLYTFYKSHKGKSIAILVLVILVSSYSSLIPYSFVTDILFKTRGIDAGDYHKGVWGTLPLMSYEDYEKYYDNKEVKNALSNLKDDKSFYRVYFSYPGLTNHNSSMSYRYKSYYAYNSLLKWKLQEYEMDYLGQLGSRSLSLLRGYPNSTIINTLLNNKYYITLSGKGTNMYGYETVFKKDNLLIEKNNYWLPIGFLYENALSASDFQEIYFPLQEEAALRNAVIPERIYDKYSFPSAENHSLDFIASLKDAEFEQGILKETNENGLLIDSKEPIEITIPLKEHELSEMNVFVDIIPYTKNNGVTINILNDKRQNYYFEKNMRNNAYVSSQYHYKETVNKVLFRMGADSDSKWVKIVIQPGRFLLKDIRVTAGSYSAYDKWVKEHQSNSLKNIAFSNNRLSGIVNADQNAVLFLSIPYSKGWKAYIDGEKAETFPVHSAYTGVFIPEGSHEIQLRYLPEGFITGLGISLMSLIGLLSWRVYFSKRVK